MSSVNKVILIGNLGKDPESKQTKNGMSLSNFSVATSESWKDKATGESKEATEWHRIVAFGRTAEVVNEYLRKGSKVFVEGKLQTRKWQDQSGNDRYTTEVLANNVKMLGGKSDGGSSPSSAFAPAQGNGAGFVDDAVPF